MKSLATLAVLLIGLNHYGWQVEPVGWVVGAAWLILTSYLIGGRLKGLADGPLERTIWGLITTLAVVGVTGTVTFYLGEYTMGVIWTLGALLPWLGKSTLAPRNSPIETASDQEQVTKNKWVVGLLILIHLSLTLATWLLLIGSGTAEAIRTPWAVVPVGVFALYGLAALVILLLARYLKHPSWLTPFYLLSLGLLPLVYTLGYGFDPFIHQASEKLLATAGTISPKPLYYLGQYTVVTFLHRLMGLPISTIDTWLAPALASLALPLAVTKLTRAFTQARPWRLLLPLAPLALTLPIFTYTTPQGLSYLWALITLLLVASRLMNTSLPRWLPWLFSLSAVACHPLTGLPLLGVVGLWWVLFEKPELQARRWLKYVLAAAIGFSVPAAFTLMSWLKPSAASLRFNPNVLGRLGQLGQNLVGELPILPRFVDLPDAVYLWGQPISLIFILLSAAGFMYAKRIRPQLRFFAWVAALMALGYLILALFATFPNLPTNEQDFYTARLLELAFLSLWPLALAGAYLVAKWIVQRLPTPLAWSVGGALLFTASWYLTYPRLDAWHRDTAYNTTHYDAAAVQLVEIKAEGAPYVVLANQAVAAAAVREFGFSRYYAGHYYYPLPTGTNPLYRVYLNAAERGLPTREVVAEASHAAGVPQVFLVLNRYWADYITLVSAAQNEADDWWEVDDGRLTIFRYDF